MDIILFTKNILETGTVSVTGTADTGFPETRLYDRAISLLYKDTVTEAKTFTVDQGSNILDVDFLSISKHNFSGRDLQWQYSNDNFVSDINDAVTDWTQADNEQIIQSLVIPITAQYWRVTVSSITNPKCGEVVMSLGEAFEVGNSTPKFDYRDNVRWNKTVGNIERSTKFGNKRKLRTYTLILNPSDLIRFREGMNSLDEYSKSFIIKDTDGDYWFCRLEFVPKESPEMTNQLTYVTLNFLEML